MDHNILTTPNWFLDRQKEAEQRHIIDYVQSFLPKKLIFKKLIFNIKKVYNKNKLFFTATVINAENGLLSTTHIIHGTIKYGPKYKESMAMAILHHIRTNKGKPILNRKGTWV